MFTLYKISRVVETFHKMLKGELCIGNYILLQIIERETTSLDNYTESNLSFINSDIFSNILEADRWKDFRLA